MVNLQFAVFVLFVCQGALTFVRKLSVFDPTCDVAEIKLFILSMWQHVRGEIKQNRPSRVTRNSHLNMTGS